MSLTARGIDTLREKLPEAHTALKDIVTAVNQVAATAGVGASGTAATPTNNGSINVKGADGIFDVAIMDPNPQRGEHYFMEWDTNPSFQNARVVHLGPSRNWRGSLGNVNAYFRFHKQLLGSSVSNYAYFGGKTAPTAVPGGGSQGPEVQPSQGSGTSGLPGQGWGSIGPIKPNPVNL